MNIIKVKDLISLYNDNDMVIINYIDHSDESEDVSPTYCCMYNDTKKKLLNSTKEEDKFLLDCNVFELELYNNIGVEEDDYLKWRRLWKRSK